MSAWKQSHLGTGKSKATKAGQPVGNAGLSPSSSQFASGASTFSVFGKPILPAITHVQPAPEAVVA